MEMNAVPPAPPAFTFADMAPPLPPPGERDIAKHVLADVSLAVGVLFAIAFSICGYLFFASDISSVLAKLSGGVIGKEMTPPGTPTGSLGAPASKKAVTTHEINVTVKTQQMTQKKLIELNDCESRELLLRAIFDEFGHLLNNLKEKQTVIACYEETGVGPDKVGRWLQVTEASDIKKVLASSALKLTEKKLIAEEAPMEVAYPVEKKKKKKNKDRSSKAEVAPSEPEVTTPWGKPRAEAVEEEVKEEKTASVDEDENEEENEEEEEGNEENEEDEEENDEAAPLVSHQSSPTPSRNGTKEASDDKRMVQSSRRKAAAAADAAEVKGQDMVGRRVFVKGLSSRPELNQQFGSVVAYDAGKDRYRVRLEAGSQSVMAFKLGNIQQAE